MRSNTGNLKRNPRLALDLFTLGRKIEEHCCAEPWKLRARCPMSNPEQLQVNPNGTVAVLGKKNHGIQVDSESDSACMCL